MLMDMTGCVFRMRIHSIFLPLATFVNGLSSNAHFVSWGKK